MEKKLNAKDLNAARSLAINGADYAKIAAPKASLEVLYYSLEYALRRKGSSRALIAVLEGEILKRKKVADKAKVLEIAEAHSAKTNHSAPA